MSRGKTVGDDPEFFGDSNKPLLKKGTSFSLSNCLNSSSLILL